MKRYVGDFDEFEIRRIERSDHAAIREAVLANRDWHKQDFPGLAVAYEDAEEAEARVAKLAEQTEDRQSGIQVFVATDGDLARRKGVYGVGTSQQLGRRASGVLRAHGLIGQHARPHYEGDISLIAGWTTKTHPSNLAAVGLKKLIEARPFGRERISPRLTKITFIRPENTAARAVVEGAGMSRVRVVDDIVDALDLSMPTSHDYMIGPTALKVAGIVDGVQSLRIPYFYRNYDKS